MRLDGGHTLTSHCAVRYYVCKTEGQRSGTMRVTSWKLRWLEDTQRPLTSSCRWPHVHYMPLSHAHTHTVHSGCACEELISQRIFCSRCRWSNRILRNADLILLGCKHDSFNLTKLTEHRKRRLDTPSGRWFKIKP